MNKTLLILGASLAAAAPLAQAQTTEYARVISATRINELVPVQRPNSGAGKAPAAAPVQRCQTAASYEQRVTAYNVVYEYASRQFSSRLSYNPAAASRCRSKPAPAMRARSNKIRPMPPRRPR